MSVATTKPAGWKEALQRETDRASDPDYWLTIFAQRPEILHRLISDLFQAAHGVERPPTVDDLWDLINPDYSTQRFGQAFKDALGDRQIMDVANKAGLHRYSLARYVREVHPVVTTDVEGSMRRIELISRALDVHPSYFAEWRRLWVMALLDRAFQVRPDLSYVLFQRLSGFERSSQNDRSHRKQS